MFVMPGSAYVFNSVAGFCVSYHVLLNLCVQSGAPNEKILVKYLKYHFLLSKIASEVIKAYL